MEVYTDGAYKPSTDQGGWAYIVYENDKIVYKDFGGVLHTTNNKMELVAIIEAVKYIKDKTATIYTDSNYIIGCITKGWTIKANIELWKKFNKLDISNITFEWVKGHSNCIRNNIADKFAVRGSELIL